MKGIDLANKNLREIVGEELGATSLWEQYHEFFTTIHYISGIDAFDEYFGNIKFSETPATLQICSCSKALLFILEHKTDRRAFAIYRANIKEVKTQDNIKIQVRTVNKITKTLKSLHVGPMLVGSVADRFVKIESRAVNGKIYRLVVNENNQEQEVVFSSPDENNHKMATDEFVKKHLSNALPLADKGGCYIATVCYGNYDAPEVIVFRKYRDYVMRQSFFGNFLIKLYYTLSPDIAKFLNKKPILNKIIRDHILDALYLSISKKHKL